jgi:hypothetical protein
MTLSVLHHWKEPTTRCSICPWSVTLELSQTDERGKAVHECCYVRKTLAEFRKRLNNCLKAGRSRPSILHELPLNQH